MKAWDSELWENALLIRTMPMVKRVLPLQDSDIDDVGGTWEGENCDVWNDHAELTEAVNQSLKYVERQMSRLAVNAPRYRRMTPEERETVLALALIQEIACMRYIGGHEPDEEEEAQ